MSFGQSHELDDVEKAWLQAYKAKNYDEALKIMLTGLDQNPNNSYYCTKIGATYHSLKNYQTALIYFQRAIALGPQNPGKYYNLGQCYYKLKQFAEASESYSTAIKLTPAQNVEELSELYSYLGAAYLKNADYEKASQSHALAIAHTLKCLKIMPENKECQRRLSYYQNNRQHEVIGNAFSLL